MNILVINSDLMSRVRLILLLEERGHIVITAPSFETGAGYLKRWKADLVLKAMPLECIAKLFCKEEPKEKP